MTLGRRYCYKLNTGSEKCYIGGLCSKESEERPPPTWDTNWRPPPTWDSDGRPPPTWDSNWRPQMEDSNRDSGPSNPPPWPTAPPNPDGNSNPPPWPTAPQNPNGNSQPWDKDFWGQK